MNFNESKYVEMVKIKHLPKTPYRKIQFCSKCNHYHSGKTCPKLHGQLEQSWINWGMKQSEARWKDGEKIS